MNEINFPVANMTIRQYFVAQAMAGLLSQGAYSCPKCGEISDLSRTAITAADACLAREADTSGSQPKDDRVAMDNVLQVVEKVRSEFWQIPEQKWIRDGVDGHFKEILRRIEKLREVKG
jgi:hypothetical protein